jgi:hypothetical protein
VAAIPAPGEAVWLPEGEAPHDEANMDSSRTAKRHRGTGLGFHLNGVCLRTVGNALIGPCERD